MNSPYPTIPSVSSLHKRAIRNSFIRFESLGLMDPNSPQYPALAFSAKFTYVLLPPPTSF